MDESGTDGRSPKLCVGGYLFIDRQARRFSTQWSKTLAKRGISCFHMTDCTNRRGEFSGWTSDECLDLEKELIKKIRQRSLYGFAVSLNESEYNEHLAGRNGLPNDAYPFACFAILGMIRRWAYRTGFAGDIAYFFEAGHQDEGKANAYLNWIFDSPNTRTDFLHVSHTFIDKEKAPPLQAADLLAWHTRKLYVNELEGRPIRRDLKALVRNTDMRCDYTIDDMKALAAELIKRRTLRHLSVVDGGLAAS